MTTVEVLKRIGQRISIERNHASQRRANAKDLELREAHMDYVDIFGSFEQYIYDLIEQAKHETRTPEPAQ